MELTISSAQGEEGEGCSHPTSKGKIGLVRKLTKGGPPKLFLMKNKRRMNNAKASKGGQSGSSAVPRNQAGVAASDIVQEIDRTAAVADCEKKSSSGNSKTSPQAVAPGIEERAFEDKAGSDGGGDNEEAGPRSSLSSSRLLPEGREDNGKSAVPAQHKIKSRKEPRPKSERRRKGARGPSAAWGALICVKKNRKGGGNEAERQPSTGSQARLGETGGEAWKQSCVAAQVCRVQSEDTCTPAGSRSRAEPLEQSLPLSGASGVSGLDEKASKAPEMEGGPEISRSDSQAKLRRKTTGRGWSSFRYLMTSKKEWRSLAERNVDSSVGRCQQAESAEAEVFQGSQDSAMTDSPTSRVPLTKLFSGKKKKAMSPSQGLEAPADPTGPARRDTETLHPETAVVSLDGEQDADLHPPGVSRRCQPEIGREKTEERVGMQGMLPATLRDELGLSEEEGQAASGERVQVGDQHLHDFALVPSESMLSHQSTPPGMQCNIGTATVNPSHLLESDGSPQETSTRAEDLLQETSTQAALGMVTETERRGLAKGRSDGAGPGLKGSGYLCKPSMAELESIPLPKHESTEELELAEPLSIEVPRQTVRQDSSNLDAFSSKNANPVCCDPKHDTKQGGGSEESTNGRVVGVVERGALSGETNTELTSAAPSSHSIRPSSCFGGATSYGQLHKDTDWNHLPEGGRRMVKCAGQWGVSSPSDGAPGREFPGVSGQPAMREAVLVQTASWVVQSAVRAAVEQLAGETAMSGVPENSPASEAVDSQ